MLTVAWLVASVIYGYVGALIVETVIGYPGGVLELITGISIGTLVFVLSRFLHLDTTPRRVLR